MCQKQFGSSLLGQSFRAIERSARALAGFWHTSTAFFELRWTPLQGQGRSGGSRYLWCSFGCFSIRDVRFGRLFGTGPGVQGVGLFLILSDGSEAGKCGFQKPDPGLSYRGFRTEHGRHTGSIYTESCETLATVFRDSSMVLRGFTD